MINFNNFNTVEVKVALQGARKEVIYFEELLNDSEWSNFERAKIVEARDKWIHTVADLNTYLNSKLCK